MVCLGESVGIRSVTKDPGVSNTKTDRGNPSVDGSARWAEEYTARARASD